MDQIMPVSLYEKEDITNRNVFQEHFDESNKFQIRGF